MTLDAKRCAVAGLFVLATGMLAMGCLRPTPLFCNTDADCENSERRYCDVEGVTEASDGIGHTCVPVPVGGVDAGVEADADGISLVIVRSGQGAGDVNSTGAGIDCGEICEVRLPAGTQVTLVSTADDRSVFTGWAGACEGDDVSCSFQLDVPTTITASFRLLKVVQLAAGGFHTCAIIENGAVRCWGLGANGRLGYGNTENVGDDETPASVGDVNVGGSVKQISAGDLHTCALLESGDVRCWGENFNGQLGYGHTDNIGDDEVPATATPVNVGGTVVELAAGSTHTCARLDSGAVRCWGFGASGRLGYGNTDTIGDDESPAFAGDVPLGFGAEALHAGSHHTCAIGSGGVVRCWGTGLSGKLGYGTVVNIGDDETPADVGDAKVGGSIETVGAGIAHTCARYADRSVRCWGNGGSGALGYGNTDDIGDDENPASQPPVSLGAMALRLAAGGEHNCIEKSGGALRCWGRNDSGQLGYGHTDNIGDDESPTADVGALDFGEPVTQIALGGFHSCVLLETGTVRCWGANATGALGYGHTDNIGDDETLEGLVDVPIL